MEFAENSDGALVSLLLNFAYIDGEVHPKEVEVIKRVCANLDVEPKLVADIWESQGTPEGDFLELCVQAMSRVTDEDLQNKALLGLCEIAAADDVFHDNERKFLSLASDRWDVDVVEHEEFVWDDEQRTVVEAGETERQEVHAGPGMGKTAVACARISKLIEYGVEPSNIWLMSFTRTAVQELRDRIESFGENSQSVLGVKIGTIDSRAWRIRCGFSDGEVERLFGSYDSSIRSVIDMIESNPRDITEFLESLDHVIIDEAQDITGIRARLIGIMIELLPKHCGVTVFADPAQAIYGWTIDGEGVPEEDRVNLLEIIENNSELSFTQRELQTIHRTDVPNLVELMEELRLDIYVNENINAEDFKKRREIIVEKANERLDRFDAKELEQFRDALVLFRRRSEVLMASSFANGAGIGHRIRMSGLPAMVLPWFGQVFSDYTDETIDEKEFLKRWNEQVRPLPSTSRLSRASAWKLVSEIGRKGSVVRVPEIRRRLARVPPDIAVTVPDLGTSGATIGTIHASKGREADQVVLRLPHDKRSPEDDELDEESRVMFVGASRARRRLYVGRGFLRASFAPSLEGGRSFLPTKTTGGWGLPAAQVEIGREGDLDPFSFVSKRSHGQTEAWRIQRRLSELGIKAPVRVEARLDASENFKYRVWTVFDETNPGEPIGFFTRRLNNDLFGVCRRMSNRDKDFRPPNVLKHLYLIGVSTFAASEDDVRLSEVHEPFASTGVWLIPIILGYSKVTFFKKG